MFTVVSTITTTKARSSTALNAAHLPETVPTITAEGKTQEDFFWTYTEEPHRTRRQAIIKVHPEVSTYQLIYAAMLTHHFQVLKLCGPEPLTKYLVVLVVAIQVICAYLLRATPFLSWKFFLTAYIIGATANQNLFLAIHEISHNLASRSPNTNRMLAIFANLPIGIPYSASFRVGAIPYEAGVLS